MEDEPIVVRITFDGADAMSEADLQASISTEATGCRSLLLRPFCLVADWPLFVDREVLDREELERDVIRLRVFYFRQGYREAAVAAELVPAGDGVEVVFHIEERAPTVIEEMEIRQSGDVLSDRTIRRARLPGEGDVLNLNDIELGMTHLEQRLGAGGYLDAEVHDSIDVDSEARRARAAVVIEPGPRSTVDRIEIRGNQAVADATIAEGLRLRPGRVLRVNHILAARRSLYESNLFHEVDVAVPEQPDSAKRVEVEVREAPPRSVRAGGGFNTSEFVQSEASYTHYNWLGGGRRLEIRGTAGNLLAPQLNDRLLFRDVVREGGLDDDAPFLRPTWQASIGFMQPSFPSAATVVGVELFANRRTIPGIAVDRGYGGDVSLTRRIDFDTQLSLTYGYELTSVESGDLYFCVNYAVCDLGTIDALRGSNAISPAAVAWRSDEVDNPIAANSGYRLYVSAEHASGFTASDFRYNRFAGDGQVYWPLDIHRRRVVAGRLRVGWVRHLAGTAAAIGIDRGGDDALLHPRKRFFAGGSQSVRGYGENQLGPKTLTVDPTVLREAENGCTVQDIADRTCDPHVASMEEFFPQAIGGTTLLEAGVEYRFPFFGGLTAAVFLDGAIVGEGIGSIFSDASRAVTPGMGARFATPVGPVRIDLGFRPNATERLPVVTEVLEEDGDRRLVELEMRRRYNPVQAAGGGVLSEVFSRMALHLSIGEAY
jgi:outer membrane protein insertion porin family/translocation and assembly module TamA